ncbi:MAG: sigma-70 family RNA polymerase sigma factor [Verrucomicrobiota bacterium]|nr:sigma-70 family RNA polymerase sigma factor [Verrucomicrobiota bacterium]
MAYSLTCCVSPNLARHTALPDMNTINDMTTAYNTSLSDIDSTCMRAISKGDQSAFAEIVERWQGRLINFFYRSTGNRADAEDLTQETFIELNRAAYRYCSQGSFKAFIFPLARRRLIDSYRKKSRRPIEYIDPTESLMQYQCETIDHSREIEEMFHRALSTLPDTQRSAILLLQQQGLSYEEIALSLGASQSAVKTWIHRARTHLRTELKEFIKN